MKNKKATTAQIDRYLELKEQIDSLSEEFAELKELIVSSSLEYGKADSENPNKRTFETGGQIVTVTTVIQNYFNQKEFKEKHAKLFKEFYTGVKSSDRVKVEDKIK